MFKKAIRENVKLRIALTGPAGSGKTYSALELATGMVEKISLLGLAEATEGKIALLDSEEGRGKYYADQFNYDYDVIETDFSPSNYVKKIEEAERAGYSVLIIDSLSHAWNGIGGMLDIAEKSAKAHGGGNQFAGWKFANPYQESLVRTILKSKMHIIATLRSRTKWDVVQETNKHGKTVSKPQKIGLEPIQKENLEFEFTVVLAMNHDGNIAIASKDNTHIFQNKFDTPTREQGKKLIEWANSGVSCEKIEEDDYRFYKEKIISASNLAELKNVFGQAWVKTTDEAKRSELEKLKDEIKNNLQHAQTVQ